MDAVAAVFDTVDVIVAPTGSEQLVITNLTGHPAVILPNGFRGDDAPKPPAKGDGDDDNIGGPGTPVSLTFLGNLYREAELLAFARAYQQATEFHRKHPKLLMMGRRRQLLRVKRLKRRQRLAAGSSTTIKTIRYSSETPWF